MEGQHGTIGNRIRRVSRVGIGSSALAVSMNGGVERIDNSTERREVKIKRQSLQSKKKRKKTVTYSNRKGVRCLTVMPVCRNALNSRFSFNQEAREGTDASKSNRRAKEHADNLSKDGIHMKTKINQHQFLVRKTEKMEYYQGGVGTWEFSSTELGEIVILGGHGEGRQVESPAG